MEGGNLSGSTKHLVHLAGMQLLGIDHLAGILLEHHGAAFRTSEQLPIEGQRLALRLQRLA